MLHRLLLGFRYSTEDYAELMQVTATAINWLYCVACAQEEVIILVFYWAVACGLLFRIIER